MCLILFAKNAHPEWNLVVAANRDEFYQRPAINANYWLTHPHILAGQDLSAGGTWLGVDTKGRFAALTNVRQTPFTQGERSRGELIPQFLSSDLSAADYEQKIDYDQYAGFNLLVDDIRETRCFSNRFSATVIGDGVHGLSNASVNTPWPKVMVGKTRLCDVLSEENLLNSLFALLRDESAHENSALPNTGVGIELEKLLSPIFIRSDDYGTRTSTVVLRSCERLMFVERNFTNGSNDYDEHIYEISLR